MKIKMNAVKDSVSFFPEDHENRMATWSDGASSGENSRQKDEYEREVLRLLNALRSFCQLEAQDIVLEAEGEKIPAHVALLRARSPALERDLEKIEDGIYKFDWMKGWILPIIHDFLYTDVVIVNSVNVVQLIEAGCRLELAALLSRCLQFLNSLGKDEGDIILCLDIFNVADSLELGDFKEVCLEKVMEVQDVFIANPRFHSAMKGNPSMLWSVYSKTVRRKLGEMSPRPESLPSPVTLIWHCYRCGATSQGESCSWCGGVGMPPI